MKEKRQFFYKKLQFFKTSTLLSETRVTFIQIRWNFANLNFKTIGNYILRGPYQKNSKIRFLVTTLIYL